jgi:hypothetical protein
MSIDKITFRRRSGDSTGVQVPLPAFGYTVQVRKALTIQRFLGSVDVHDFGQENDYRTVEFSLLLTEPEVKALSDFFKSVKGPYIKSSNNHEYEFAMAINAGSNFFPAGPDYGGNREFMVSMASNHSFSTMRTDYFGMFDCKLHLLFHNLPHIDKKIFEDMPPDTHGVYDFGEVKGLRDPEREAEQEYAVTRNITLGGRATKIHTVTDEYTATITQRAATSKMAELAYYLQRDVRDHSVTIKAKKNYWLFGPDNGMEGKVNVRLLDNTLTFVHEDFDLWSVKLQLWREIDK